VPGLIERGMIYSKTRKQQINDFSGLVYGKITPTDIDGCIEYHNRLWVFFEVKMSGVGVPFGQRLALERLVIDTSSGGKKSIALVIDHDINDVEQSIPVADCYVRKYFYSGVGEWTNLDVPTTTKELIDSFLAQ
jgi:hypothetical protein